MRVPRRIVLFNLAYFLPFTAYYLAAGNREFLWYAAVLVAAAIIIADVQPRVQFGPVILWGLSLWGLMHLAGGSLRIGDGVLYRWMVLPLVDRGELQVLRFDQVVHFFGFGTCTLIGNHLLRSRLRDGAHVPAFLLVMIGMGFGAFNELVEFAAVLMFPSTGVGGYENTALDLAANAAGAVAAVIYLQWTAAKNRQAQS